MSKDKKCPCCGSDKAGPIRIWRTRTMYVDNRLNFQKSCYRCIEENDYMRYWDWIEYYSGQYGYYDREPYVKRSTKGWYYKYEYLQAVQPQSPAVMEGSSDERGNQETVDSSTSGNLPFEF